jgi:hypothetical protein
MFNYLAILSIVLLSGCQANNLKSPNTQVAIEQEAAKENQALGQVMIQQWQQGIVVYNQFEGGFYGIVTEQGERYLPNRFPEAYKRVGTLIHFRGKVLANSSSIYQWGKPFDIVDIKLIKLGSDKSPNH